MQDILSFIKGNDIHICTLVETWFDDLSLGVFLDIVDQDGQFRCFAANRENRKFGDNGSGGVAILVKKTCGDCDLPSKRKVEGVQWIRINTGSVNLFVGCVYFPPWKGGRIYQNNDALSELEADIVEFQQQGMVMCMGDFNAHIGNIPSIIGRETFGRVSCDGNTDCYGKTFVSAMNSVGFVILNGVNSVADFTYDGPAGKSVVDFICVDSMYFNSVSDVVCIDDVRNIFDTDHNAIFCAIKIPSPASSSKVDSNDRLNSRQHDEALHFPRFPRLNKIMDYKLWIKIKRKLEDDPDLKAWVDEVYNDSNVLDDVDSLWHSFKVLFYKISVKVARAVKHTGPNDKLNYMRRAIIADSELMEAKQQRNKLWRTLKAVSLAGGDKKAAEKVYVKCRNQVRKKIQNIRYEWYEEVMAELEGLKRKNPKLFWYKLRLLSGWRRTKKKTSVGILSGDNLVTDESQVCTVWSEFYRKLGMDSLDDARFNGAFALEVREEVISMEDASRDHDNEGKIDDDPILDKPISREEVQEAIEKLTNYTGTGDDGISAEILKYGGEYAIDAVWLLFERFFDTEQVAQEPFRGVIIPIHKAGDKLLPDNYRGITLLSVVGKVYAAVLQTRLSKWYEGKNLFAEEQCGFRPGRGTRDQIFTLSEVITARAPHRTYCCFIDIKKAFDRVWRDGLWKQLWEGGVKGKLWRVIRSLYKKVESKVMVDGKFSDWFEILAGLRQGCSLSPTLFDIFINSLALLFHERGMGVRVAEVILACLLFADDIVLMADTAEELQKMMDVVTEFAIDFRFELSQVKSNVVIYGRRDSDPTNTVWRLGGVDIAESFDYKYLGVALQNNRYWNKYKQTMLTNARSQLNKVYAMGMRNDVLTVKAAVNAWCALVRPSVEYGAEIWGHQVWRDGESILHEMGRRILRCNRNTSKEVIRGELGWWTLKGRRDLLRLRYYAHIVLMKENRLPRKIYSVARALMKPRSWCTHIKRTLYELQLGEYWESEKIDNAFYRIISKRIAQREELKWKEAMSKKPKLRLYRKLKTELRLEKYLICSHHIEGRKIMTKLRSGTNFLRVDVARQENLLLEQRVCLICDTGAVEDEAHFLLHCQQYSELRNRLFDEIEEVLSMPGLMHRILNDAERLDFLIGSGSKCSRAEWVSDITKKYLFHFFHVRSFYLKNDIW